MYKYKVNGVGWLNLTYLFICLFIYLFIAGVCQTRAIPSYKSFFFFFFEMQAIKVETLDFNFEFVE